MSNAEPKLTLPKLDSSFGLVKLFQCDETHDRGEFVRIYVVLLLIQTQSQSPFVCSSGFIDEMYQTLCRGGE
jgi:hypothetical protein